MTTICVRSLEELEKQAVEFPETLFTLDLSLQWVRLDEKGLQTKMDVLARSEAMHRVADLYLSSNNRESVHLIELLLDAPYLPSLRGLFLDENRFNDQHIARLVSSDRFAALEVLNLNANWFGDEALEALGASPLLPQLRTLDVGVNFITSKGVSALLSSVGALKLENLVLGPNMLKIGDAGAMAIATSPALAPLRLLDLGNNDITDDGAVALASSPYLKLHMLNLSNDEDVWYSDCYSHSRNKIGDRGAAALAASPAMASLGELFLNGNPIGEKGLHLLKESIYIPTDCEIDILTDT